MRHSEFRRIHVNMLIDLKVDKTCANPYVFTFRGRQRIGNQMEYQC